jgi:hypothetical protein
MAFDLSDVTLDPDMGSPVTIIRTTGKFAQGGWTADTPQQISAFGVVGIADDQALEQVPEGDRVTGALQLVIHQPIFPTSEAHARVSDQIRWMGNLYRLIGVAPWKHFGFYSGVLVRMTGA